MEAGKSRKPEDVLSQWRNEHPPLSSDTAKDDETNEVYLAVLGLSTLTEIAGTSAARRAINELANFVSEYRGMSLHNFIGMFKSNPQGPVGLYVEQLRSSQKDETLFPEIFARLKSDPTIKVREANQIADALTGITRNRTKKAAFTEIENEHRYFVEARKRREAAGGKSAA